MLSYPLPSNSLMLKMLYVQDRFLRASDFSDNLNQANNPDWKTVAVDETSGTIIVPKGSIGFRWGETGQWNIEQKAADGKPVHLRLSLIDGHDEIVAVGFPYFGGAEHPHFTCSTHDVIQRHNVPVRRLTLVDGSEVLAATVFDLLVANYGVDRGLGGRHIAAGYEADAPYTPAWQKKITGVSSSQVIAVVLGGARPHADAWLSLSSKMSHFQRCAAPYPGYPGSLAQKHQFPRADH